MADFWCNPIELLTPMRFDILFKYVYAYLRERGVEGEWVDDIYGHHLEVWNGLKELNPPKIGLDEYKIKFHEILDSIKENGFDDSVSYVPFDDKYQSPLNGAHRIAAAILFNKEVYCKSDSATTGQLCSYKYLLNRKEHVSSGLSIDYADMAALEYCRLKKNTYIVTLFPSAVGHDDEVRQEILQRSGLIYEKSVDLINHGPFNFTRLLYDEDESRGNPWLGNWHNNFCGARSKMSQCFTTELPLRIFLIEADNIDQTRILKENIRKYYGLGNHSVHINDTHSETLKTAGYMFNKNSIHFLNYCNPIRMIKFESCFQKLCQWIADFHINIKDICVGGSAPLSAYGIRDCRDLDFLCHGDYINTGISDVSCHNEEMKYYMHTKNNIIFNPQYHFYYKGIKFSSLDK